jgi:hypothetical protein
MGQARPRAREKRQAAQEREKKEGLADWDFGPEA